MPLCEIFTYAAVRTNPRALPRFLGLVAPPPQALALDRAADGALACARVSSMAATAGADGFALDSVTPAVSKK